MSARAHRVVLKGQVTQRHEANSLVTEPGSAALVFRGVARSLVMACPDGCGEQLTINLDSRSGRAWRFYGGDSQAVSLYPSVWKDTGCRSHFIVWRSRIYWCDWHEELDQTQEDFQNHVLAALTTVFASYVSIAESLETVPWAVLSACNQLCRIGLAEAGIGKSQGHFRRKTTKPSTVIS